MEYLLYISLAISTVLFVTLLILEETYTVGELFVILLMSFTPFFNVYCLLFIIKMFLEVNEWLPKKWRQIRRAISCVLDYKVK